MKTWCPVGAVLVALLAVSADASVVESPPQGPAEATPDVTGQPRTAAEAGLLLWRNPGIVPAEAAPMIDPGSGLPDRAARGDVFDVDLFGILPPRPDQP